jgi:hypothetical protein
MYEYENPGIINPYWVVFRILFKFIIGQIFLAGVIVWWVCKELLLEYHFYKRFGSDWRTIYEKYHGSLSHAHFQIAMCLFALVAVTLILLWYFRQTYHKHTHKKRDNVTSSPRANTRKALE